MVKVPNENQLIDKIAGNFKILSLIILLLPKESINVKPKDVFKKLPLMTYLLSRNISSRLLF